MSMRSITTKALVAGLAVIASLAPGPLFTWQRHRESAAVTNDPALLNKGPIAPPSFVHPRPLVQPRPFVTRHFVHRPFVYGDTGTSTPGVINYPHGQYELHGDGVAAPYTWVWIPNPPSSPPPATAPAP